MVISTYRFPTLLKGNAMIRRELGEQLLQLAEWYPVVSVTGPRQSGKSTLVQDAFPDYRYVNLEDPSVRARAVADPTGFVLTLPDRVIIDEAQYAPELFSAIQARADERRSSGQFILSGSQNFLLLKSIKQSLAGRVGIAHLLPLSFREIRSFAGSVQPWDVMVRGSYPALHVSDVPTDIFYENYLDTYVTRDVVGYLDVRNERDFRRFLAACAARAGNLLNYADLSRDVGVSVPTIRSWVSILESSFVVRTLEPYHANISKRLAKTPKLYFYDTGLLCHLLGLSDAVALAESPYAGAVFEDYVISEELKRKINGLKRPQTYFYRDDSKIEIDMIDVTDTAQPLLCEMKSGRTYRPSFARHLAPVSESLGFQDPDLHVVYGGEGSFTDGAVHVDGITEWLLRT